MSDSVPRDVFLDTSFVVNAVFGQLTDSLVCREASRKLRDESTSVYSSMLMRLEFAQSLRRLATLRQLPGDLHNQFELDSWNRVEVRHRWMDYGIAQLESYLQSFSVVTDLPVTPEILAQFRNFMAEYALGSPDAAHLATGVDFQIPTFWTCDDHFDRVTELSVDIIRSSDS
jgi:predicted nucleic acid-binding protein